MSRETLEGDKEFMARALALAERGAGRTSPNPMVGAVFVRDGKVIGEGYHRRSGAPHAEIEALRAARGDVRGATLYLNLEPCCHYGRTPPCTETLVQSGVERVVAAMRDPNPLVSGRGVRELRKHGVKVSVGVLENEARKLNEVFIKFITTGLPFVTLKCATTLDGKIATRTGDSKWITCERAREEVHKLRNCVDAILVGSGTVEADDPLLTTRLKKGKGRDAMRILLDSDAHLSRKYHVFSNRSKASTWVAVSEGVSARRKLGLERAGATVIEVAGSEKGAVNLTNLMRLLGQRQVTSVLIEGGSRVFTSALEAGIVDKVVMFIAPVMVGGKQAPSPFEGIGTERMNGALRLRDVEVKRFDNDVMISGYLG